MTKRIKLMAILMSAVLLVALVASIGATAAIWSSSGTGGNGEVGPNISDIDWNAWQKYFAYNTVDNKVVLTEFHQAPDPAEGDSAVGSTDVASFGFNHCRLIIPKSVGDDLPVVTISGSLFSDVSLKEMVEELYIPNTVTKIEANAFSGLTNLKKVVFEGSTRTAGGSEILGANYVLEMFSFAGTTSLAEIYVDDQLLQLQSGGKDYTVGDDAAKFTVNDFAFFGSGYALA